MNTSWWSRRTRFQLAPLMDLLLIIVFAQFLDVRETSQQQAQSLEEDRQRLELKLKRERSELAGIEQALEMQRREWTRERDRARASRDAALAARDVTEEDAKRAMTLLSEWFDVDEKQLNISPSQSEADVDQAVRRAKLLAQRDPDEVVRFLIGHAELLKRAEIWTIHAMDTGEIRIQAGDNEASFRLEGSSQRQRTQEVADQLFAAYKQLPEPKGLVILLVSYDPRSVAGVYQPLVDGMPTTLERLRGDTPTSRFEYTVLGATPDPFESRPSSKLSTPATELQLRPAGITTPVSETEPSTEEN